MAHKVSDACVGCGACEGACPVGAITVDGVASVNADASLTGLFGAGKHKKKKDDMK